MAKFCNNCGSPLREAARFCNICGSVISKAQAPAAADSAYTYSVPTPPPASAPVNPPFAAAPPAAPPTSVPGAQPASVPGAQPQYFESYDFNPAPSAASSLPGLSDYPSGSQMRGASKPLPPLSDFFGENSTLEDKRERAKDTIMNFSLWAAGIVILPIPFTDFVLLAPLQTALIFAIAKIYGVKEPTEGVIGIIAASCGTTIFGQLTAGIVKAVIPIVGGLLTAPFIFGWTYAMGKVAVKYFESKGETNESELKSIFKQASKEAAGLYDPQKVASATKTLDNLRNYMSEEEYQKLRSRFSTDPKQ